MEDIKEKTENIKEKIENKNFIDCIVDFFGKFKIFKPLAKLYYNYRQVLLYLFFGLATTVVNIISYEMLVNIFKIDYLVSNVIAWIIAVIFAYITNKTIVFESKVNTKKEKIKELSSFLGARIFSLGIDMGIMYLGVSVLLFNDTIVKVISNVIVIVINYFFSKFIIFKKR